MPDRPRTPLHPTRTALALCALTPPSTPLAGARFSELGDGPHRLSANDFGVRSEHRALRTKHDRIERTGHGDPIARDIENPAANAELDRGRVGSTAGWTCTPAWIETEFGRGDAAPADGRNLDGDRPLRGRAIQFGITFSH